MSCGGEGRRDAGAASGCFRPPHADSNEFETVSVTQCLGSTTWAGLGSGCQDHRLLLDAGSVEPRSCSLDLDFH